MARGEAWLLGQRSACWPLGTANPWKGLLGDRARAGRLEGIGQGGGWCEGPASGQSLPLAFFHQKRKTRNRDGSGQGDGDSPALHLSRPRVCGGERGVPAQREWDLWALRYRKARCLRCRGQLWW